MSENFILWLWILSAIVVFLSLGAISGILNDIKEELEKRRKRKKEN